MVFKALPEEKFTEEELIKLIKYNERPLYKLSMKFYYFTYLDNEDLVQEGKVKIIEIVRRWEKGEINVPKKDLSKYIGRSLVNYFIDLIRKSSYSSQHIFDPSYMETFWTYENHQQRNNIKINSLFENRLDQFLILGILENILNPQELEVATYYLYDWGRKQIAEAMNLSTARIDKIRVQIKEKLYNYYKDNIK